MNNILQTKGVQGLKCLSTFALTGCWVCDYRLCHFVVKTPLRSLVCYRLPMKLWKGHVSLVSVCGYHHMTITYDPLDLTIQGHPLVLTLTPLDMNPHCRRIFPWPSTLLVMEPHCTGSCLWSQFSSGHRASLHMDPSPH